MKKLNFEKLARPLLKKIGKNLTKNIYDSFIDYLNRNNIEKEILDNKQESFEDYFNEFVIWHFGDNGGNRLDFSEKVKNDLLKRSGGCCTICGTLTIFPQENDSNKSLVIAAACHIKPASKYGPRANYDTIVDIKAISSLDNGLWACLNCHKEIDTETEKYSIEYLKELKSNHEKSILKLKKNNLDIRKIIESFELRDNSKYAYIPLKEFENISILKNKLLSEYEKTSELSEKLKNIERNVIKDLSIFKMIKELNFKKEEIFGKGTLQLKISDDDFIMRLNVDNIENIQQKIKEYSKQFNNEFKYEIMNSGYKFINKKESMVMQLSNLQEKFEFFIINEQEDNIIKIKKNDFKIFETKNETGLPSILIEKRNDHLNSIISLELTRFNNGTSSNLQMAKINYEKADLLDFSKEFLFLQYIENFNIDKFYFIVRYENIIFEMNIFRDNN